MPRAPCDFSCDFMKGNGTSANLYHFRTFQAAAMTFYADQDSPVDKMSPTSTIHREGPRLALTAKVEGNAAGAPERNYRCDLV